MFLNAEWTFLFKWQLWGRLVNAVGPCHGRKSRNLFFWSQASVFHLSQELRTGVFLESHVPWLAYLEGRFWLKKSSRAFLILLPDHFFTVPCWPILLMPPCFAPNDRFSVSVQSTLRLRGPLMPLPGSRAFWGQPRRQRRQVLDVELSLTLWWLGFSHSSLSVSSRPTSQW